MKAVLIIVSCISAVCIISIIAVAVRRGIRRYRDFTLIRGERDAVASFLKRLRSDMERTFAATSAALRSKEDRKALANIRESDGRSLAFAIASTEFVNDWLKAGEPDRAREEIRQARSHIVCIQKDLQALGRWAERLRQAREAIPERLENARQRLEADWQSIDALRVAGYRIDADRQMVRAIDLLRLARDEAADPCGDSEKALSFADHSAAAGAESLRLVQELVSRHGAVSDVLSRMTARIAELERDSVSASAAVDRSRERHAHIASVVEDGLAGVSTRLGQIDRLRRDIMMRLEAFDVTTAEQALTGLELGFKELEQIVHNPVDMVRKMAEATQRVGDIRTSIERRKSTLVALQISGRLIGPAEQALTEGQRRLEAAESVRPDPFNPMEEVAFYKAALRMFDEATKLAVSTAPAEGPPN